MVGLPCSGKTHWVNNYVAENPMKSYTVLGNTHILDKMKVINLPLKNSWNLAKSIEKTIFYNTKFTYRLKAKQERIISKVD